MTFVRQVIDKEMARCVSYHSGSESHDGEYSSLPSVVLLLHVPADQLHSRPCYQTIPLNGWSAIYVDAFCDGLLRVDGERESSTGYGVIEDQSPQWMRVAFSLDSAPSLADIRREFSHLAPTALAHAVQAISFEQRPPMEASRARRVTRQQYFERAGVVLSMKAYSANNRDWVIGMFAERPYLLRTLTESFSALWGRLLQHTVQVNCERLVLKGTSKGLVESVRATHKWLISDFVHVIVKNDLAADWALEALAGLPVGEFDTERVLPRAIKMEGERHTEGDMGGENYRNGDAQREGARERVEDSTPNELAALTVCILKGIVAIRSNDHIKQEVQYSLVSTRVNCSNSPVAPRTPLFQSLISLLERLIPKARHRSHRLRTRESVTSEIQSDATALRSLLLEDTLYADIARAVEIIEGNGAIFASWKMDFIGVTLGYGGRDLDHTREELEALSAISMTLPELSTASKTDMCRWLLLRDSLQSHLNAPSRLLVASRGVLLCGDIKSILNMTVPGVTRTDVARDIVDAGETKGGKDRALAVHGGISRVQGLQDGSQIFPSLQELCVRRLWALMFNLAGFSVEAEKAERTDKGESSAEELMVWVRCVREMTGIVTLSFESMPSDDGSNVNSLGREDSGLFYVMSVVLQIIGITEVNLGALTLLLDIDNKSISDPLSVTLGLISNAALEVFNVEGPTFLQGKRFGRLFTICLEQVFNIPHAVAGSSSKGSLIASLLGDQHPPHLGYIVNPTMDDVLLFLSSLLTLNARCHFITLYMAVDSDAERDISTILTAEDPGSVNRIIYIPDLAAYAVSFKQVETFLDDKEFPPNKRHLPPIKEQGASLCAHTLVFRAIYLCQYAESKEISIQKSVDDFIEVYNANLLSENKGYMCKIRTAGRIVHLLNATAHLLSHQGVKSDPFLTRNSISDCVSFAIATAPRVWTVYLLSRLNNVAVTTSVVECKELLELLGIPWIHCFMKPRSDLLPEQYAAQLTGKGSLTKCLTVISYAAALVIYRTQQLELDPTSTTVNSILLEAERAISTGTKQHKAVAFVSMLATQEMSSSLAMNVHIPVILSIYTFLRDRLAFRLKDITVARTLLVIDAIDALPIDDRILGRKIFEDFLTAWAAVRNHFHTFDICGREVQAAREIPALTPETTYVSMLVEMEGADVHESLPAMIVETRLLKLTTQVLRHNTLETLAGDETFNRHEYLTGPVRSESVACLPHNTPLQLLLTGSYGTSSRGEEDFNRMAANYSTWNSLSDPPAYVNWSAHSADSASIVAQIRDKMAKDNQMNAHTWGMILCPSCNNRYERASGCSHVTCGNPNNAYAGRSKLAPVTKGTCGMQLDAETHRVPPPGQFALPVFIMEANTQHIPASLFGNDAPRIPVVPPPKGRHTYDWPAIATHLFSTVIRGRVDLKVDKNFFAPLLFAMQDSDRSGGVLSGVTGSPNLEGNDVTPLHWGFGDLHTRLRLAADMVTSELDNVISRGGDISEGADSASSESNSTPSAVTPTQQSMSIPLTDTERRSIINSASRQEERVLDALCDQALTLCLGILGLIGQGYFNDLASSVSETISEKYSLSSLFAHIKPPTGSKGWSPLLKSILNDLPLCKLFPAVKCLAIAGAEGSPCSHSQLCAELPQVNKEHHIALQKQIIEAVKNKSYDTSLITVELQAISSLLSGISDDILNENSSKPLADVTVISKYIKDYPNTLGAIIVDRLKVKHYGQIMQFLRQTLGHVAYNSLLVAQQNYDLKGTMDGKQGYQGDLGNLVGQRVQGGQSDVSNTTERRAPLKIIKQPVTYRERVPIDWESLQNVRESSVNREHYTPAPALLLQVELGRTELREVDDEWEIVAGSYTDGEQSDTADLSPPLLSSTIMP